MSDTAHSSTQQQFFEIQKLYLKDVSFEAPNSPLVFTQDWQPDTNVQITTGARNLEEGAHEVVLNITITAKSGDKTAYLVEVQQAGIFAVRGFAHEQLGHLLGSYCPNILFPFAREAVAELINKGGFPSFLLAPVNFDALYAQHQQKLKQQAAADKSTH